MLWIRVNRISSLKRWWEGGGGAEVGKRQWEHANVVHTAESSL